MKYLYLSSLLLIIGFAVQAQLRIVPQLGIESSRTTISYNNSSNFAPLGTEFSRQASIRADYTFKKFHGPFVGLSTSRPSVTYAFSDPETGKTNYTASRENTQLRFEAGYQLSTKPIYFNKTSRNKSNQSSVQQNQNKKGCAEYFKSRCGSKFYQSMAKAPAENKGSWVSIQPSAGMAFVPGASSADIAVNRQGNLTRYEYAAGDYKTALIAGTGFVFGNNDRQKLVVSVNYLRGIGNLQNKTLQTTNESSKPITTNISSNVSNWNLRVGIPLGLTRTKKSAEPKEVIIIQQRTEVKQPAQVKEPKQEKKCGSYQYRCRRAI